MGIVILLLNLGLFIPTGPGHPCKLLGAVPMNFPLKLLKKQPSYHFWLVMHLYVVVNQLMQLQQVVLMVHYTELLFLCGHGFKFYFIYKWLWYYAKKIWWLCYFKIHASIINASLNISRCLCYDVWGDKIVSMLISSLRN